MKYIQFFNAALSGGPDGYVEATGDRSVVILDGREKRQTHLEIANAEMLKRGYKAFQLFEGESFTRSHPITTLYTE